MTDRFGYLDERLDQLRSGGRFRELVPRGAEGIELVEPDGRRLINFGGNDYLGLAAQYRLLSAFNFERAGASHRLLRENADVQYRRLAPNRSKIDDIGLATHGFLSPAMPGQRGQPLATGSGASALVCGWTAEHDKLAGQIAELESTEAAVVFPSGFAACSGAVATLAEAGDLVLSDELNHASLIDGCRLARAERVIYPHRDVEFVARVLEQRRGEFARVWIVTDGVFSMDGHVAPLAELCDIAERHDATVIADEAHGTGVLGASGSGVCEALGVKPRVPIRIGTLSKAIGTQGGFVAAPRNVIDYLINRCRPLIYSTALAPAAVEAARRAIVSFGTEPERRQRVQALARGLREALSLEADRLESSVPIVPVVIGADADAVRISHQLAADGFFVPAIRPPTVPEGTARLRISLSAAHSDDAVQSLAEALHRRL